MPYHHPVGVAVSVLWWGIFFGCFGMNIGALCGLWAEQTPVPRSQLWDGAAKSSTGANGAASLARDRNVVHGVNRATDSRPGLLTTDTPARTPGR
jgi:hypothetical protein